ncbi:MAG: GNAT family N-acetyltransferase [Chitinophagaceae bacterium]|nr:GNAT family N-acetyltransferase [Chitinophagaceae bacterium]
MIPFDLTLETKRALLRPLRVDDYAIFLELAKQDADMWYYFSLNLGDEKQLQRWFEMAFADKASNTRRPFTIIDKQTGKIAGSSSLGNISLYDLRAEIGWSWLGKDFRSTGLNKHAKYVMMKYAFEELNFERIEFKTDEENARARKGLENAGGIAEGVLRSHMTMWNNRRRSSIYYSVVKDEWPGLQKTIFSDME